MTLQRKERRALVLDPVAVERAEAEIDKFINSRSKQREEANSLEAVWAASERRELAKRREENRTLWIDHYQGLVRVHIRLAKDARRKARALERGEA